MKKTAEFFNEKKTEWSGEHKKKSTMPSHVDYHIHPTLSIQFYCDFSSGPPNLDL